MKEAFLSALSECLAGAHSKLPGFHPLGPPGGVRSLLLDPQGERKTGPPTGSEKQHADSSWDPGRNWLEAAGSNLAQHSLSSTPHSWPKVLHPPQTPVKWRGCDVTLVVVNTPKV